MRTCRAIVAAAATLLVGPTVEATVFNVGPSGEHAIDSDGVVTDVTVNFGTTILLAGGWSLRAVALG